MRLLILNATFLPKSIGGAELHTFWIARELKVLGHEVKILYGGVDATIEKLIAKHEKYEGLDVIRLSFPPIWNETLWSVRPDVCRWALEELDRWKPTAIHIGLFWNMAAVAHAAEQLKIPFVLNTHLYSLFCSKQFLIQKSGRICDGIAGIEKCKACVRLDWSFQQRFLAACLKPFPENFQAKLRKVFKNKGNDNVPLLTSFKGIEETLEEGAWLMRSAAAILAPTKFVAELHKLNRADPERVIVWGYGIPPVKTGQTEIEREPASTERALRFAVIGRLAEEKGIDILIEAVKKIPIERVFSVGIYGDLKSSSVVKNVERLLKMAEGEKRIRFKGPVLNDEIDSLYHKIDMLVVPSNWYEVLGITALEALARKIPVLVSNMGGLPEAVEPNKTGFIFKGGDPDDLARAMLRILDDPNCINQMRDQIGHVHTINERAKELEAILLKLV